MGSDAAEATAPGTPGTPGTPNPTHPGTQHVPFNFAGKPMTAASARDLANDPVLSFGAATDAAGRLIPGEMWLVVAQPAKVIGCHLSEAPESGPTSYGGHRILLKTVSTHALANFGAGVNVPLVGNDRDAFVVAHTDLFLDTRYLNGGQRCTTPSGNPCKLLRPAGSTDTVSNVPFAGSAMRRAAIAHYAADGALIEPFGEQSIASAPAGSADAAFAALAAAAGLDDRRRGVYADLVWGALNEATREAIEARMAQSGYQYQSEFARTYFAQGEAAGQAKGRAEGEAKGRAELLAPTKRPAKARTAKPR